MDSLVDTIVGQVLQMSEKDGALIAERLISSPEAERDTDVEAEWCEEAQRRIEEIETGSVRCARWEDIRQQLDKNAHSKD